LNPVLLTGATSGDSPWLATPALVLCHGGDRQLAGLADERSAMDAIVAVEVDRCASWTRRERPV
jgi:hypothetical protein